MIVKFPPVDTASEDGLLAIGGNLDTDTIISAYKQGVFPWPISKESPLTWFAPDPRGILYLDQFHVSRSLTKALKKENFQVTFNQKFKEVIHTCATIKRKHEKGTWISTEIINGYIELFKQGHAYSVEVYKDQYLVGGLYGVCIGEIISGESMFYTYKNASKVALYSLVEILKKNKIEWIDTQMVTPVLSTMGGKPIARDLFMRKLTSLNPNLLTRDDLFRLN